MKITVDTLAGGTSISWFSDIDVCIATASSIRLEISPDVHPRIRDAAEGAYRELSRDPNADLRHYEGMTLPPDETTSRTPDSSSPSSCGPN